MQLEYIKKLSCLREYEISNILENIEFISYCIISLFLPMFLKHPQFMVGTAVNMMIVLAVLNLKSYRILPIIILPSVGAFLNGILFGQFTVFLLYFIPFIWIGNMIMAYSFKQFYLNKKMNFMKTALMASFAKSLFLFTTAFILYSLNIVPMIFLTAMGIMQLITAIAGSFAALPLQKIKKHIS